MDLNISSVDYKADLYEVKDALAQILHGPNFHNHRPGGRNINFHVRLNLNEKIETRNIGTGQLTLPTEGIGKKLLRLVKTGGRKILVRNRPIRLDRSSWKPNQGLVETLLKVPYQDPSLDREKDDKLRSLNVHFRVDNLQFGIWGVRPSPSQERRGVFCKEWEKSYTTDTNAQLWFDYDHKVLRIQLGDPAKDDTACNIVIRFSTLRNLWSGFDFGNPCTSLKLFETEGKSPLRAHRDCFDKFCALTF